MLHPNEPTYSITNFQEPELPGPQNCGARQKELGQRIARAILLTHRTTTQTEEGTIPILELSLVARAIVPPYDKQQKNEDQAGNQTEERQGSRRHGRCIGRDGIDVKDQPADTDKRQNGPSDYLEIRPFQRRGQPLGKGRLLSPLRGRPTHKQVGPAAAHRDSTQPGPPFTSEEPLLVSQ
jgi:hypothetical protein